MDAVLLSSTAIFIKKSTTLMLFKYLLNAIIIMLFIYSIKRDIFVRIEEELVGDFMTLMNFSVV